jgi:hypothetical protein
MVSDGGNQPGLSQPDYLNFSCFLVARYHWEWETDIKNCSTDTIATRRHSLLSYGCVAGHVLLFASVFNAVTAIVLDWWAKCSKTSPSTALALTAVSEYLTAISGRYVIPAMYLVMAAVSIAGIWMHRHDWAARLEQLQRECDSRIAVKRWQRQFKRNVFVEQQQNSSSSDNRVTEKLSSSSDSSSSDGTSS